MRTPMNYRMYGEESRPKIEGQFQFGSESGDISEDTFLGFYNKDGITSVEIEFESCF